MANVQDDPLAAALASLLRADSDQALAEALTDHAILGEADALFALVNLFNQALAAQQNEAVARLVVFLVMLIERYNHAHSEQIAVETHQSVIGLYEQVIPLAERINDNLAVALRRQAGWACNTLGNHYVDEAKDLEQAVAAYTRGLGFNPSDAMLLRNRAGVHLDRRDLVAARVDIETGAALEPDAPRLAELREQLAQPQQLSPGDAQ